ncbi:MAG: BrnT family toxin [candidate division NC10 bacterium]|nr:BrnT family toxin [candidate division NC10 bacterium]
MRVAWDPEKAKLNLRKHGIHFSDAEGVLFDPHALTEEDQTAQGEHRYVTIGLDSLGRILVVVYAYRGDDIRLISARRATRKERRSYETGI